MRAFVFTLVWIFGFTLCVKELLVLLVALSIGSGGS